MSACHKFYCLKKQYSLCHLVMPDTPKLMQARSHSGAFTADCRIAGQNPDHELTWETKGNSRDY